VGGGRVARCIPKMPILVYFESPCNVDILYISLLFCKFHSYFVYFIAIWYILCPFGIFHGHLFYFMEIRDFFHLVCCTKKNLAILGSGMVASPLGG
jgi:hypothetical protein